jgi:hypothetical protein
MARKLYCFACGEEMEITASGVSHHLTSDGEIDYDADADHVAYAEEEEDACD